MVVTYILLPSYYLTTTLTMEKREQLEIKMQSDAYQKLYNTRPELRGRIFAVNNNSENAIKGALNKSMGVYPGVSDMLLMLPLGKWVCIEWKTPTGSQSPKQIDWQKIAEQMGNDYILVRSEIEFFEVIDRYTTPKKNY